MRGPGPTGYRWLYLIRLARRGLVSASQRRGVTPLVLLLNFFGPQIVEVFQQRLLHELGMQIGDAIDGVAADASQVSHADVTAVVLINE